MSLIYKGQTIANVGGSGGGGGVPKGTIVIWSGAATEIPSGWAICDGQNGTPDLRDRFVLGAGTNHSVGETGGAEGVKMTEKMLAAHSHELYVKDPNVVTSDAGISAEWTTINWSQKGRTASAGYYDDKQEPIPTVPPYYALCYIMKIAEDSSGSSSGGSSEEIYSTEETRIGTWVDGKPLYRLVFDSYIPDVASSPRLLGNVTDMDTMVYAYGRIRASNTNFVDWPIPNYVINLMKQGIGVYGMVMGSYVTEWSGKPITVIVEYTKTTDEATS